MAVLALAWIAVLAPAVLRARSGTPLLSARRFRRRMDLISPGASGAGRWVVVIPSARRKSRPAYLQARRFERSQRRRTRLLVLLFLGVVGSGIAAVTLGRTFLEIHLGLDSALAFYVALLLDAKRRRRIRGANVYSLQKRRRRAGRGEAPQPLRAAGGRG